MVMWYLVGLAAVVAVGGWQMWRISQEADWLTKDRDYWYRRAIRAEEAGESLRRALLIARTSIQETHMDTPEDEALRARVLKSVDRHIKKAMDLEQQRGGAR